MIATADSVTEPGDVAGKVLVAGSHGGLVAAHYAAGANARAVILNDAGIGLDEAGVAGLELLDRIGMAAAAVSHESARIGDGADMLSRGLISRVNASARKLGIASGMRCGDAAVLMLAAAIPSAKLPPYREGRYELDPGIRGLDSVGMLGPEDEGCILVIGSHASLHGGRPESALAVAAALAVFNDAGGGGSRLPALDQRGIAAAAVDCMTARIGDARSMWETGVISNINRSAAMLALSKGMSVRAATQRVAAAQKKG
jgi:hypothetical protein